MLELFIFGTFWFWALIIAEIVLLFVFIENENGFGATVALLVGLACLQWMGDTDIIGWVASHPMQTLGCVGAFFLLGAVWGTVKWWIYCRDRLEIFNEFRAEFLAAKGLNDTKQVPPEYRREFKDAVERNNQNQYDRHKKLEVPKVRENKARIMRWMTFWPISLVWSFLDDFVKRTFRVIYYRIQAFLQSIADNMFSGMKDDLDVPEDTTNTTDGD